MSAETQTAVCVGIGTSGSGCGLVLGAVPGHTCNACGGMLLSPKGVVEAALTAANWAIEELNQRLHERTRAFLANEVKLLARIRELEGVLKEQYEANQDTRCACWEEADTSCTCDWCDRKLEAGRQTAALLAKTSTPRAGR